MVTGLRALAGGAPRGECELHLTWATGRTARDKACDSDGRVDEGGVCENTTEQERRLFTAARDMSATAGNRGLLRGARGRKSGMRFLLSLAEEGTKKRPFWRGVERVLVLSFVIFSAAQNGERWWREAYKVSQSIPRFREEWCPAAPSFGGVVVGHLPVL